MTHARRQDYGQEFFLQTSVACAMPEMQRIIFNDRVDAALVALFLAVVLALLFFTIRTCIAARRIAAPTAREIPAQLVPAE